jgi:hypothetical protein
VFLFYIGHSGKQITGKQITTIQIIDIVTIVRDNVVNWD